MPRRHTRTDGLSHHVTTRLTQQEIGAHITKITATPELQNALMEILDHNADKVMLTDHGRFLLDQTLEVLRQAALRSLLSEYPDNQGVRPRSCRTCGCQLEQRPKGGRGRPREFCGSVCRQAAYRRRNGQQPRDLTMTKLVASVLPEIAAELRDREAVRSTETVSHLPTPRVMATVAMAKAGLWRYSR